MSRPTSEEFAAAKSPIVKPGVSYRAMVRCSVEDSGDLSGCHLVSETPSGSGFGAVLLSLTPKYRRKPPGADSLRTIDLVDDWSAFDKEADWLKKPTANDLLAVYPTEALKHGQDGRAVISCVVTLQGALTDCIVVDESPGNASFGRAALALTPQFLMKPATLKGAPVLSVAQIPIYFVSDGAADTTGSKKVATAALMWTEAPTYAEVAAAYPQKAKAEGKGGRVTLSCSMTEAGHLAACHLATVEPKGYGFDAAARTLAQRFVYPVGSAAERKATHELEVHVPFVFDPAMLSADKRLIGKPSWAALPTAEQVRAAFDGVKVTGTARASLSCTVKPGGSLADCKVVSETPTGLGVGAGALTLAPTFRMTTWTTEGLPVVGGAITIPIRYEGDPPPK